MPNCSSKKILKTQKALVTGANSGIGKAVAIALGQAGADVVVNDLRSEDMADEVVDEKISFDIYQNFEMPNDRCHDRL